MIFKDYYKILGMESNKANVDDIKVAYREQAKKYHPDVNVGNINAEERFKDINEAYNILSNNNTRKKYDRMWNSHIGRKREKNNHREKLSTKEEVLNLLFGINNKEKNGNIIHNAIKVPIQGESVETEIDVSIKEAFFGETKKISLRTINGKMKNFSIKIPEGIRNGEKIRLIGQGKIGKNGGKNGDLLIKINIINDNQYKLIGSDIYEDVYITPWEAVLGTKVEIASIDEIVSVYIPKGSQTGEMIKIEQKGYKDGNGSRGFLILQVKIVIGKNINNEEKELYKQLKKISKYNPRM